MKRSFISLSAIAACLAFLVACGNRNNNGKQDSVDSAKSENVQKGVAGKDVSDFVTAAANAGMAEVQMGQYASQYATDPRVKRFGSMMVEDHTKANQELKSLASARNIAVPSDVSDDEKKHMTELTQKKGKDFDKSYIDMMMDGHKKVISNFEKAASNLSDSTIKNFAQQTLPVLQKHLDSLNAIKGSTTK